MNRLSSYFPLFIVGFLAIATFWLEQVVNDESHGDLGKNRHDPDFIVDAVTIKRFDAEGKRISQIDATKLQHYPDDDTADLTLPIVTLTRDARPTELRSQTAHANNETKVVVMQGNVRGERKGDADTVTQTLATEELTVLTDDEIARTDLPVVMTQGANHLEGVGAEWNNLTGALTVNSRVRATLPRHSQSAPASPAPSSAARP